MSLAYPLIVWGAPDDFTTGWSNPSGGGTRTPGQADPFGGTLAVLLDDVSGAIESYFQKTIGVLPAGVATVVWMVKVNTAPATGLSLYSLTAATYRQHITVTWTGGIGAITAVTGGTNAAIIALGAGWYLVLGSNIPITAGESHALIVRPAGFGGGAPTGSTYCYLRNTVLLEVPRRPVSWDEQRGGSEVYDILDGTADAALLARDYRLRGDIGMVPAVPRSVPQLVSGWDGANEFVGVNVGVEAMVKAGQDAQTLTFVPDRNDVASFISSELVHPVEGDETVPMPNGSRGFTLELRNTLTPYPGLL